MNNTIDVKKYAVNFSRSRANLLAVVGFTIINIFLVLFQADWQFLFSATIPTLLAAFGVLLSYEGLGVIGLVIGAVLALLGTGFYLLFYFLSKKYRVFILIAMVLFAIDTLIFLVFALAVADAGAFIDLAFSGWVMYYLIIGTIAWAKLRNVSAEEVEAAHQSVANEEANTALNEISKVDSDEKEAEEKAVEDNEEKA